MEAEGRHITREDERLASQRRIMSISDGFDLGSSAHSPGDRNCKGCPKSYPRPCKQPDCVGLVHVGYYDDWVPGQPEAELYCDTCKNSGGAYFEEACSLPTELRVPRDRAASQP